MSTIQQICDWAHSRGYKQVERKDRSHTMELVTRTGETFQIDFLGVRVHRLDMARVIHGWRGRRVPAEVWVLVASAPLPNVSISGGKIRGLQLRRGAYYYNASRRIAPHVSKTTTFTQAQLNLIDR